MWQQDEFDAGILPQLTLVVAGRFVGVGVLRNGVKIWAEERRSTRNTSI